MANDLVFELSPTQKAFVLSDAHIAHLIGPMGEGKCLKKGTKVLMYDGSSKAVEDVCVGDLLMGDDSTPRTVLALGGGTGDLYEVIPYRGNSFCCNAEHILSLKRTSCYGGTRRGKPCMESKAWKKYDVELKEYVTMSKTQRNLLKLYRVPIDFASKETTIEPYFLGLWLGDGSSDSPAVTTPDPEITDYLYSYASQLGLKISINKLRNNKADTYHLSSGNNGRRQNVLLDMMRDLHIIKNKHIPALYKCNSRDVRMQVLAGLADSDGYVNRNSYQFIFKQRALANDTAYLCRSLGFAAYVSKVKKSIKSLNFTGDYYLVGVSGDLSSVPVLIERKKCPPRNQKKDVLMTGIKEIRSAGFGDFFGFIIDGNRRFLLGDFTVTHNTHAGLAASIWHAKRCGRPIQAALIRDTHQNIKTSTVKSIQQILGGWGVFKNDYKKLYIRSNPPVEFDLFGIDDEASISKLQGPEYALIWLEEPAPILEKANAGLPKQVFDLAVARAARQQKTKPRVQITQNPSDGTHWTDKLMEEPEEYAVYEVDGIVVKIIKHTFHIPKGENKHLTPLARAMQMAAFKDDPGKWERYIEGRSATVQIGKKVTPAYSPTIHFSQKILPVYPENTNVNLGGYRGWDGYQHPCCIIAQNNMFGQLVIHDVLYKEGIGTEELIEIMLLPLLAHPKYKNKITTWREIGDPSMRTPDQSSIRRSAAKVIEKKLKTRFEPCPTRWGNIIDPTNRALRRMLDDGRPAIILSASAATLHHALKGGWHYKTDNNGRIIGSIPVKDEHSHPGDAFGGLISTLMPYDVKKELRKADRNDGMTRAISYGSDRAVRRSAGGPS